ncbi:MAG TPA: hypothetical protein VM012_00105 [Flavitalea sp.]|nr:hypothetical protein [Flavitalea sp.]
MQDLINRMVAEAGISEDQARKSLEAISGYVKEKYPAAAGYIDKFLPGKDTKEKKEGGFNIGGFKF